MRNVGDALWLLALRVFVLLGFDFVVSDILRIVCQIVCVILS